MEALTFNQGVKASLPTALGYVSIGIACGVVGASSGISPLEMGLMKLPINPLILILSAFPITHTGMAH